MSDHKTSADRFEAILASIAGEEPSLRGERWQGLFDRLAGAPANHLVLFGASYLGRWVLSRLRKAGVEPCCFSDNNSQLWGTSVHGLVVLNPEDAVARFGNTACFVVTIYNGSAPRRQLNQAGCASVLPVAALFWKYPETLMPDHGIDSPDFLAGQLEPIRQCYALLSDEASRHELCDQLAWRYWMRPESLPLPTGQGELYFPSDLITENEQDVIVDGGACDGDTIRSLVDSKHTFRHLYALEPDSGNLVTLKSSLQQLPEEIASSITVWPYAVGDKDGSVRFVETHNMGSRVSATEEGIAMEARKLDSLPWQARPTYIKLDIEGSEPFALSGGAELLKREMPVLAICLYHRSQHLWEIPNLIHALAPGYAFYLRRYAEDCWEEVCYAVPPNRLRAR